MVNIAEYEAARRIVKQCVDMFNSHNRHLGLKAYWSYSETENGGGRMEFHVTKRDNSNVVRAIDRVMTLDMINSVSNPRTIIYGCLAKQKEELLKSLETEDNT